MLIEIDIRDGEADLIKKVFEDDSFHKVLLKALNLGLEAQPLRIDRVAKEGPWISTEESTNPLLVLYFKSKTNENYLITQRPGEKKCGLFEYRWTP